MTTVLTVSGFGTREKLASSESVCVYGQYYILGDWFKYFNWKHVAVYGVAIAIVVVVVIFSLSWLHICESLNFFNFMTNASN